MNRFSTRQLKAAKILQSDIPLSPRPFADIARASEMTSEELIAWIRDLSREGIIRKVTTILRHQKAGYGKNVLVLWSVTPEAIEDKGRKLAGLPYISHCYERKPFAGRYNLFTMLHAKAGDISHLLEEMSRLISCPDFLLLESLEEYKKTSPEYF
ncbi:MAG TPA: hypothetical protein P5238_09880 [Smithellaceae bacterium]|nr:hypothetical protein [Smithellaceae bacterium]HRS83784.1 hypothetical protein [Smithellaceae bacterium]